MNHTIRSALGQGGIQRCIGSREGCAVAVTVSLHANRGAVSGCGPVHGSERIDLPRGIGLSLEQNRGNMRHEPTLVGGKSTGNNIE